MQEWHWAKKCRGSPLGLVLCGANDIFDVEADRLNPRKGTFLFGSLGAEGTIDRVAMADCGPADPFCDGISGVDRRASFAVVWGPTPPKPKIL